MINVLDHGFVDLKQVWGSDEDIIAAARQSTSGAFKAWGPLPCPTCGGTGTTGIIFPLVDGPSIEKVYCPKCKGVGTVEGDEKLLRYLYTNKHFSPFEMAGATFEVKAPIMVFREWHRHRTQSYNEMSARYIPIPNEHYIPTVERLMMPGGANKQAQGTSTELSLGTAQLCIEEIRAGYDLQEESYQYLLGRGVPKELARLVMPVGRYSKMWASANLRNWMHFLELRMDEAAQWEIRQYANTVHSILSKHFPLTMELFNGQR